MPDYFDRRRASIVCVRYQFCNRDARVRNNVARMVLQKIRTEREWKAEVLCHRIILGHERDLNSRVHRQRCCYSTLHDPRKSLRSRPMRDYSP